MMKTMLEVVPAVLSSDEQPGPVLAKFSKSLHMSCWVFRMVKLTIKCS